MLGTFSPHALERLEHSGNSGVPNLQHHEFLSTDLPGHNNSGTFCAFGRRPDVLATPHCTGGMLRTTASSATPPGLPWDTADI
jgi:hypothetical protein